MGVRLMFDNNDRVAQEAAATEDDAATGWWFPALNMASDPGGKVNAMLAEFASGGRLEESYTPAEPPKDFKHPVAALPKKPTGAGFRKGATSMMTCRIAMEFIAYITGHTLAFMSLSYYIITFLCMMMPGARVLAGRAVPIYGRACGAPPAPSLAALQALDADWREKMDEVIDRCFRINNASHPKHRRRGSLRPVLEMNLAALIMYYNDLVTEGSPDCGLLTAVVVKLREAFVASGLVTNVSNAHVALMLYSERIKVQFQLDNVGDVSSETEGVAQQPIAQQACCMLHETLHAHRAGCDK